MRTVLSVALATGALWSGAALAMMAPSVYEEARATAETRLARAADKQQRPARTNEKTGHNEDPFT